MPVDAGRDTERAGAWAVTVPRDCHASAFSVETPVTPVSFTEGESFTSELAVMALP